MKRHLLSPALAALALMSATPAQASADLAKSKNCMACHAADKKLIGPSYKDVAAKYASDKDASAKLAKKIREGGVGIWGQIRRSIRMKRCRWPNGSSAPSRSFTSP
jgi:cytochrome c